MIQRLAILFWLSTVIIAPQSHHSMKIAWNVEHRAGLQYFFLYRQSATGWTLIASRADKPNKKHWRVIDRKLQCGQSYTYLLVAQGVRDGETYLEDYRVDNTFLFCKEEER